MEFLILLTIQLRINIYNFLYKIPVPTLVLPTKAKMYIYVRIIPNR